MIEDLQNQVNLGEDAKRMLENPAFAEMFRRSRDEINHAWQNCDARDIEGQKLLLMQAKVLNHMEASVGRMIEGGKLAFSKIKPVEMSKMLGETPFQQYRRRARSI